METSEHYVNFEQIFQIFVSVAELNKEMSVK